MTNDRLAGIVLAGMLAGRVLASDIDEFKVKRQEVFEFTEKPKVTREGDGRGQEEDKMEAVPEGLAQGGVAVVGDGGGGGGGAEEESEENGEWPCLWAEAPARGTPGEERDGGGERASAGPEPLDVERVRGPVAQHDRHDRHSDDHGKSRGGLGTGDDRAVSWCCGLCGGMRHGARV